MRDGKVGGTREAARSGVADAGKRRHGLGSQTQSRIGMHLRAMYDSVVQQPIPDRFTDLIARLGDEPRAGGHDKS